MKISRVSFLSFPRSSTPPPFFVPIYQHQHAYRPVAAAGIIDLREWDCASDVTVPLNGEWAFYWSRLLTPSDLEAGAIQPQTYMNVPGHWNGQRVGDVELPINGYATYRLQAKLSCNQGTLALKTSNIRASNRIFVNGDEIGHSGSPAATASAIIHRNTPYAGYFQLRGSSELDIVVQVASFKSFNSGMVQTITLGRQDVIAHLSEYNVLLDGIVSSGFLFIGLYFFVLYFQRNNSKELIYFAFVSFSGGIYQMTHSERLLMKLLPSLDVMPQLWIENLSALGVLFFFSRFTYYLLPGVFSRKALRVLEVVLAACAALVIFTKATYYAPYIYSILPMSAFVMGLNGYYMYKASLKRRPGAVYLTLSAMSCFIMMFTSALNTLWQLDGHFFLPIAQPILVISQALYMSLQFTNDYNQVRRLTDKLSAADKLKDEFLANTSHEFKSPLNGIINISQSLIEGARGPLGREQSEDLQLVRDIGRRLTILVNDILDYSRMKHRDLVLHIAPVDLSAVVGAVIGLYGYAIKSKPLLLDNRIAPAEFFVLADENRLYQIIRNLIDNAVKYTERGSVTVTASAAAGSVKITVSDTGRGIPPDRLESVFMSYEQAAGTNTQLSGGVGLGLFIARQLAELQGGTIAAASSTGGTQMVLTLPAAPMGAEAAPAVQAEPSMASDEFSATEGHGPTNVLIVDDDYSNLRTLLNVLALDGYTVTAVGSGEEALRRIDEQPYDLCILDIMMPGMTGYELCKRIRERYALPELPVLLVTAGSSREGMAYGFEAGANDFLLKPYDMSELRTRVRTLIALKQAMGQVVQKELAFLQAQIKPHFLFNTLNTILSLSHTDHAKSRTVLQNFSAYLRYSFDFRGETELSEVRQELTLIRAYVDIELARFGSELKVAYDIDPEAGACRMPSLMLQPIVENAIHHGVMRREEGGTVRISVHLRDGRLHVNVRDDGVGFAAKSTSGVDGRGANVGLENIRKRLMHLYNETLWIESSLSEGTSVTFSIPQQHR
ncbi:hybrid sensor histidine kinase/response regulator [Cohnella rhizosphaerae]|uniref:histidine kinase n=1 Tax=Cohnella rhizosphaerae TaxID=1457232 RepID=A0A9X4L0B6_9BACL|nr:ATP-binding protein [Cohnella rhizosphaerae]MDG0811192.1 ATP-binding protein [Cohnella rhizosphaerae]